MKLVMLVAVFVCCVEHSSAQSGEPILRGLSVYAGNEESGFPALVRNHVDKDGKPVAGYGQITIQYDILAGDPPEMKIRFFHCNRDWKPDNNLFVNDNSHNGSFILTFVTSPGGVIGYSYRYINKFPDADDAVRFDYSGNWIFKILDKQETTLFAEGRFFVVDNVSRTNVSVANDYLTENTSPYNQIHRIVASVKMPDEIDGDRYTTADVYQNRRIYNAYRIDMWDKDPYTFVDGQGTGKRNFKISNIMPGNEYRVLDLSNATQYPNKSLVKNVNGADQVRVLWRTGVDHNGNAVLNKFGGINSEYLDVLFRLDITSGDYRSATSGGKELFLAGAFNFWHPTEADRLAYDDTERFYTVRKFLRRGIYDYQYVAGIWDAKAGAVLNQDWLAVEGNDWRTTNTYTVLVYYNDPRFGGFDRIVGIGHGSGVQLVPGSN